MAGMRKDTSIWLDFKTYGAFVVIYEMRNQKIRDLGSYFRSVVTCGRWMCEPMDQTIKDARFEEAYDSFIAKLVKLDRA